LVEYYFKIDYTDRDTTFLHGSNSRSIATADEAIARAAPFTFVFRQPLDAGCPLVSFDSGPHQARVFRNCRVALEYGIFAVLFSTNYHISMPLS
jgi:hypothetical protein